MLLGWIWAKSFFKFDILDLDDMQTIKANDNVVFKTSAKEWNKRTDILKAIVDSKYRSTNFVVLRRDGNMLNVQAADKSYSG